MKEIYCWSEKELCGHIKAWRFHGLHLLCFARVRLRPVLHSWLNAASKTSKSFTLQISTPSIVFRYVLYWQIHFYRFSVIISKWFIHFAEILIQFQSSSILFLTSTIKIDHSSKSCVSIKICCYACYICKARMKFKEFFSIWFRKRGKNVEK